MTHVQYQNPYGYQPYYGGDKSYRKGDYQPYGGASGGGQHDEDNRERGGARGAPSMLERAQKDSGNLKVWIFLNGIETNPGFEVSVNKKKFPHWINFLDFVTESAQSIRPIDYIFTIDGQEVESFVDMENGQQYVAAHTLPFKKCNYSSKPAKDWNKKHTEMQYEDPGKLDSAETVEIYLKKREREKELRQGKLQRQREGNNIDNRRRSYDERNGYHRGDSPEQPRKARAPTLWRDGNTGRRRTRSTAGASSRHYNDY